jgi:predicted transcriptional regulator
MQARAAIRHFLRREIEKDSITIKSICSELGMTTYDIRAFAYRNYLRRKYSYQKIENFYYKMIKPERTQYLENKIKQQIETSNIKRFIIPIPNKNNAVIAFPSELNTEDFELLIASMSIYMKRFFDLKVVNN